MALLCLALSSCGPSAGQRLRTSFQQTTGRITLPAGTIEITEPLVLAAGAHDIRIVEAPAGSTLKLAPQFRGKAAVVGERVSNITISGFRIVGHRTSLRTDRYLPPWNVSFLAYYDHNGIVLSNSRNITIRDISLEQIESFPILISHCDRVGIERISIENAGTLNRRGHNNTTGGILLEEGTSDFNVTQCRIHSICGNAIWTHSNAGSPRNQNGVIEENEISSVARDAIQVGHALRVRVSRNHGSRIGTPADQIDVEALATPVALDSAGNVDQSIYESNDFTDVNGQCIDLDGFHDGKVEKNSCTNRLPLQSYPFLHAGIVFGNSSPEVSPGRVFVRGNVIEGFGYGAVFLVGEKNEITDNSFIDLNRRHCAGDLKIEACNYALDEPDMLRSGIYLASHAARPARTAGNVIAHNVIRGFGMISTRCVVAGPGVKLLDNHVRANKCDSTQ